MNIIAVDIGNSTISVGLFVDNIEKFIESVSGGDRDRLSNMLIDAWGQFPFVKSDTVHKREGVIVVSSVKPDWCDMVKDICADELDEKIKVIGVDIDLPIEMAVDNKYEVGTDRIVAAAAAFAVVEDAVVVADFGSAVTIDLIDEQGVFLGGVIAPGFGISAEALGVNTAQLPEVEVARPRDPVGGNTHDAINAGLYYSAVGLLKTVCENYAEQLDKWPQTIVTGGCAETIKPDCEFVDSWVPNLVIKGIVLAYKKHLSVQAELGEMSNRDDKA
ncbi:MAG: type III pantothenate kinase [Planctomycetes bacterium]|nr:type III pantothenate kinase [Planctomycetota bacterium]